MLFANAEQISSEFFDSEVVVIHFLRGTYFSLRGAGMALWSWLQVGADRATLARLLADRYGLSLDRSDAEVERFLAPLRENELVIEKPAPAAGRERYDVNAGPASFEQPVVEVFTDLQELIALDPVHEVDPMQGWPHRPPKVELD